MCTGCVRDACGLAGVRPRALLLTNPGNPSGVVLSEDRLQARRQGSGFGVQGPGARAQGSGFRVRGSGFQGLGFGVQGFRVRGSGFRVSGLMVLVEDRPQAQRQGSGFRVQDLGLGLVAGLKI